MNIVINIKNSLDNLVFLFLLISVISYWIGTSFKSLKTLNTIGLYTLLLSNMSITVILSWRWAESGYFPLSNLYESLLCLAWGSSLITIILELKTSLKFLSAVTTPLSMFIVAFATLSLPSDMQKSAPLVPALKSNWLMMHVSVMMLSYSTLIIGSLLSIVFLLLYKQNQSRSLEITKTRPSVKQMTPNLNTPKDSVMYEFNRLTILDSLDNLSYRVIGFGFPLLTIGIIAGAVWANEAWGSYWSWDPKETWALITWLVFAAYLHTRITKSWQGKGPAILASIGFIVVWICYLGVNFLGKGLHSYGWIIN
jgi:cytochrome c-type biogenesis protein CcsB